MHPESPEHSYQVKVFVDLVLRHLNQIHVSFELFVSFTAAQISEILTAEVLRHAEDHMTTLVFLHSHGFEFFWGWIFLFVEEFLVEV